MTTGDPFADAIVGLVLGLVDDGIHELDPVAREKKARDAVEDQLSRFHAADPGSLSAHLDAAEQAQRTKLAEQAAALTRVSSADVSVAKRLIASPMLTPEETASVMRLADHVSIALGDGSIAQAAQDHVERTQRSDEPTVELPVGPGR